MLHGHHADWQARKAAQQMQGHAAACTELASILASPDPTSTWPRSPAEAQELDIRQARPAAKAPSCEATASLATGARVRRKWWPSGSCPETAWCVSWPSRASQALQGSRALLSTSRCSTRPPMALCRSSRAVCSWETSASRAAPRSCGHTRGSRTCWAEA